MTTVKKGWSRWRAVFGACIVPCALGLAGSALARPSELRLLSANSYSVVPGDAPGLDVVNENSSLSLGAMLITDDLSGYTHSTGLIGPLARVTVPPGVYRFSVCTVGPAGVCFAAQEVVNNLAPGSEARSQALVNIDHPLQSGRNQIELVLAGSAGLTTVSIYDFSAELKKASPDTSLAIGMTSYIDGLADWTAKRVGHTGAFVLWATNHNQAIASCRVLEDGVDMHECYSYTTVAYPLAFDTIHGDDEIADSTGGPFNFVVNRGDRFSLSGAPVQSKSDDDIALAADQAIRSFYGTDIVFSKVVGNSALLLYGDVIGGCVSLDPNVAVACDLTDPTGVPALSKWHDLVLLAAMCLVGCVSVLRLRPTLRRGRP